MISSTTSAGTVTYGYDAERASSKEGVERGNDVFRVWGRWGAGGGERGGDGGALYAVLSDGGSFGVDAVGDGWSDGGSEGAV